MKNEPLKIISFVIDLNLSIGPVLKYSSDKTTIEMINNVNRENFFREISINMSKVGSTRLRFLEVDNKKVATSLSFLKDNVKYLYNSGYDPEYSYLSVGVLNHVLSIQNSILEKHTIFDFMRGDEVYKYRLGGVDETVSKLLAKKR